MGTMLQKSGLEIGGVPELLSLSNPDLIESIHRSYIQSGADIIYANTFGANALKLARCQKSVKEVIEASIGIAKKACLGTNTAVALDIGPLGELLEPSGTLSFERAYELFCEIAIAGEKSGADLAVIETMTDLYEVKAAVLAIRENTNLPVLVSMSFEQNGRTFTGCSIEAMASVLEGLGVCALGINCSLGPVGIYPLAKRLCASTSLGVFVKPNAGLPNPVDGTYDIDATQFGKILSDYHELGICMLGGCCGTTPEYIKAVADIFKSKTPKERTFKRRSMVCTPTRIVAPDGVAVIGERINPTGKKLFKQALLENNIDYILAQAVSQADAGADILDVNVGMPGIDEVSMLKNIVKKIQSVTDLPLQIDSSNPDAIEAALRIYNGKAIVNSVNGEKAVLERILPIVKKYGASVVALTLDENGIPDTAEGRIEIAKRILDCANSYGIPKEDVYVDTLTLTASAQQEGAKETLKALRYIKHELGLRTVLGVSNISFGLPNRELLNSSFLTLALGAGLDFPIINPNAKAMMDAVYAYRVLSGIDKNSQGYIERFSNDEGAKMSTVLSTEHTLAEAVKKGLVDEAHALCAKLLETSEPLDIVNAHLIPALDEVGADFESGKLFLPQLLSAANAAQAAFEAVKAKIAASGTKSVSKGKIVIATVKGDIHDIGKNIVKVILENYGYTVIDLGRDVEPEIIVKTAKDENAQLVGLSALMTTTLGAMEDTIKQLSSSYPECRIMVGGAVVTQDYAKNIGAHYYAKDAKRAADIAKEVFNC
ncbi:MAG: homocysteine methyltransferase [Ruminococcaceae bacterium]|nr:homocysteine methyltransferase [Oscillospiraceae bacterium]